MQSGRRSKKGRQQDQLILAPQSDLSKQDAADSKHSLIIFLTKNRPNALADSVSYPPSSIASPSSGGAQWSARTL